jgi:hypothetical protein
VNFPPQVSPSDQLSSVLDILYMYFVRRAGWSFEELDIKRNRDNSSDDGNSESNSTPTSKSSATSFSSAGGDWN